jgi:hypothetical protein
VLGFHYLVLGNAVLFLYKIYLEIDLFGSAISALRRAIAKNNQSLVMGWVTKNLLSPALLYFGRHIKPLVQAAFAVVSTPQFTLGPRGCLWPVLLMCNS